MARPLTEADLARIPEPIARAGPIAPERSHQGLPVLRCETRLEDGRIAVVEEVRSRRRRLAVETMYVRGDRGGRPNPDYPHAEDRRAPAPRDGTRPRDGRRSVQIARARRQPLVAPMPRGAARRRRKPIRRRMSSPGGVAAAHAALVFVLASPSRAMGALNGIAEFDRDTLLAAGRPQGESQAERRRISRMGMPFHRAFAALKAVLDPLMDRRGAEAAAPTRRHARDRPAEAQP